MAIKEKVVEELARVGYETMFEDKWDCLPTYFIEKALWRNIAEAMLNKLRELWEEAKYKGG